MKNLKERLLSYLETLSGTRPDLSSEKAAALPLFLRERYKVFSTRLFGRRYLLALEVEGWESGSPGEYAKQVESMRRTLGAPVVLVLRVLPSYARNRMVQMGTPFIVPGNQIFLPERVVDLREHFPQPRAKRRETLSPAAQCTVLYHLLRAPLNGISLKAISRQVEYSQMMLTKVKDELEAAGICKAVQSGRSLVLEFASQGLSLWELAKPRLTSPVKRTRWVRWKNPGPPALLAGMSALSRRTMITDDRLPTYALPLSAFQDLLEKGVCVGCRDAEHATASLQVWSYNPRLLGDETLVDPLSLYLSLRAAGDERIEQQLEQLIQEVKW
jgi:hypothetical protein